MYLVMTYWRYGDDWFIEGWYQTGEEAQKAANLLWLNGERRYDNIMIVKQVASREEIERL